MLMNVALVKALRCRPFAILWASQTVSQVGNYFTEIAFAWLIVKMTGSPLAMGAALLFSRVPVLMLLLFGGVVVDRLRRAHVMLVADVVQGSAVLLLAWAALSDDLAVWHIFAVKVLFGLAYAFYLPAYRALVPEITPKELLPSANSITTIARQVASIIGPPLAGWVVAAGGTAAALGIDGLSYFFCAALLLFLLQMRTLPPSPTTNKPASLWRDAIEGLRFVVTLPWLSLTIAVASLANMFIAPVNVLLPFLVESQLHLGADGLGVFWGMFAAGSISAATVSGSMGEQRRRGMRLYLASIFSGLLVILLSLTSTPISAFTIMLMLGFSTTVTSLILSNILQSLVPQEKMGRVMSVVAFGEMSLSPIGIWLAAWYAEQVGVPMTFVIGGAGVVIMSALALFSPHIRRLD
ncbi:MAG: MFS transporter [Anaerolineales bacterium]|nr:MFS transporter [Anaerolineales bacterium]